MAFPQSSVPRDGNRVPALNGVSSSDLTTPVPVSVDPATNRMLVSASSSVSSQADGINLAGGIPVGNWVYNSASWDRWRSTGTGDGNNVGVAQVAGMLLNGSNFDRPRGNLDNISLVASAAYTTTQTSADQTNYNGKGVIVTLDVTNAGTGSVTLEIDYKDPVSGKYVALLTGAAVTTTSTNMYTVYPGVTAAANSAASMVLPRTWRVKVTANNANSVTYSVGASVIL